MGGSAPDADIVVRLVRALERSSDFVGVTDDGGRVVWLNPAARRLLGVGEDVELTTAELFPPDVFERYFSEVRPALLRGEAWTGELAVRTASGGTVDVLHTVVGEVGPGGEIAWLVTIGRDISEHEARVAELTHRATRDALTGLANRVLLLDRLEVALARSARSGLAVAVVFADVDRLKGVNDVLGHDAGDALLRAVGARLAGAVRPSDTVARLGGDEFVVVCEPIRDDTEAKALVERLQDAVEADPVDHAGTAIPVRASWGVAVGSGRRVAAATLLAEADRAMFRARARGTHIEMGDVPVGKGRASDDRAELAVALTQRQVVPHFRSLVRQPGSRPAGWYAVPRWIRGDTVVPAEQFLPLVVGSGMAVALDLAIVRGALRAGQGRSGADTPVLVPVSARLLVEPNAVSLIGDALDRHHVPDGAFTMLLPGSAVVDRSSVSPEVLAALRAEGVRLGVVGAVNGGGVRDLVGAGVEVLTVDRDLVAALPQVPEARAALRALVGLARGLDAEVLALGVGTSGEEQVLVDLGVTWMSGRRYGTPLPSLDAVPSRDAAARGAQLGGGDAEGPEVGW